MWKKSSVQNWMVHGQDTVRSNRKNCGPISTRGPSLGPNISRLGLWRWTLFWKFMEHRFAIVIFCFRKSATLMTWHQPNPVFKTTIGITRVNKAFKLLLFPKTIISKLYPGNSLSNNYQRCLDDVGITAPNPFLIIEINFLKTKICGRHNWIFSRPMMTPNNLGWL